MKSFIKNHKKTLKYVNLICMAVLPLGLYFAAANSSKVLVYQLLAAMGMTMFLAMISE